MEQVIQDVRYALRGLRRSPGFTLVAILTLALGIGVNSSIFGLVNAVLFRPLPVERPNELVNIYSHATTSPSYDTHSYPDYVDYRDRTKTLSDLVAFTDFFGHLTMPDGTSGVAVGELVSGNYFRALGVRPVYGRAFTDQEAAVGGDGAVAVISDQFWHERFGADPAAVGRTFRLNGLTYAVIGIAPPSFGGMAPAVSVQLWLPVSMVDHVEPFGNQWNSGPLVGEGRLERRANHWLWLKGRMRPGVSVEQVRTEFESINAHLAEEYPQTNSLESVALVPTNDVRFAPDIDRTMFPVGMVLLVAVALVLAVACANLANLMLARATGRRREMAVRLALGAARKRVVRQLLTESLVLAIAGGGVAFVLAAGMSRLIARLNPPLPVRIVLDVSPDWRVLAFTFAVAVITGIVFGLVPAWRASRPDLVPDLKSASGVADGKRRAVSMRDALVVVQMAVSVVLVVGGILLMRSLSAAGRVDLGYDADRVAMFALPLSMSGYDAERGGRMVELARQRLAARPDVEAVALTSRSPLELNNNGFRLFIDGRQVSANDKPFAVDGTSVDEHYADAFGLRLIAGRNITTADCETGARVAVITRAMAERYWPGDDAVGRSFRTTWGGEPYRVVGVVADYKVNTPGESPTPYLHLPLARKTTYAEVLVRTRGPAAPLVSSLQADIRGLDPDIAFLSVGTVRDQANVRLFPVVAGAWLIGVFGMLALALAAVGLYGVVAYSVSRRVREIGIRKALGARSLALLATVAGRGMTLVAVGGVLGAALAAAGARTLSNVLFVPALDPPSFALALGVLGFVALLANIVPARRAARIDPSIALREE